MKLLVPFVYKAEIIKPRCRKSSYVYIKDQVEVELKEISANQLPVAFRIGSSDVKWDGSVLWDFDYETTAHENPRKVSLSEVVENTRNYLNYPWSTSNADAPFHNFWLAWDLRDNDVNSAWLKDECVLTKEQVQCRKWVADTRLRVIEKAKNIADKMLFVDGVLHRPVEEPRYEVVTFGLGNNHASTAMFVVQSHNPNISDENYFNALQLELALEAATQIATRRGDTASLPIKPNGGHTIEVLIPEAVKLPENSAWPQ